jgi:hypothetical protein
MTAPHLPPPSGRPYLPAGRPYLPPPPTGRPHLASQRAGRPAPPAGRPGATAAGWVAGGVAGLLALVVLLAGVAGGGRSPDMFDEAQTVLEAFHAVDSRMVEAFGPAAGPADVRAPIPGQATLQLPFAPPRYLFASQYSIVLDGVDQAVALEAVTVSFEAAGFTTREQSTSTLLAKQRMRTPSGRTRVNVHVYPPGTTGRTRVSVSATSENMRLPRGYADIGAVRDEWELRFAALAGPLPRS